MSTTSPPLFPVFCVCIRALHKEQHSWVWFHSFSQSKHTQTVSPAVSAWGTPGQVGVILPWTQHVASPELVGCSRLVLPCPPYSAGHQLHLTSQWWEKPAHLPLWKGVSGLPRCSHEDEATLYVIQAGQRQMPCVGLAAQRPKGTALHPQGSQGTGREGQSQAAKLRSGLGESAGESWSAVVGESQSSPTSWCLLFSACSKIHLPLKATPHPPAPQPRSACMVVDG